jgi:hypothetical protein
MICNSAPDLRAKKTKKKLVTTLGLPLEGMATDKCPHFVVQKKIKKLKKKLVRAL